MKRKVTVTVFLLLILTAANFNITAQMYWNNACQFEGNNLSYLGKGNSSTLNITGSFTIEMWINPVNSTNPSTQTLLQKREGSNPTGYTLYLSTGRVALRTNSSTRLIGNIVIPNNTWSHIAGRYNSVNGQFAIHVNGMLELH